MEPKTAQELMDNQRALEGQAVMKSEFTSCDPDESRRIEGNCTMFKKTLSCSTCGKACPSKSIWSAMKEFTLERNHLAAQSVTRNSPQQEV